MLDADGPVGALVMRTREALALLQTLREWGVEPGPVMEDLSDFTTTFLIDKPDRVRIPAHLAGLGVGIASGMIDLPGFLGEFSAGRRWELPPRKREPDDPIPPISAHLDALFSSLAVVRL